MGSMGDAHSGISSCSSCCQAPDTSCLPFDKYEATTKVRPISSGYAPVSTVSALIVPLSLGQDGWRLVFKHYPPTKQATIKQVQPVLLAHGLGESCGEGYGQLTIPI